METKTIDFPITNRWTGEVQLTARIEASDDTPLGVKIGLAVKWAIKERADLARADLADAYLARADLAGADLAGANLARADLAGAYLAGANLADANLARAYLAGADLAGADLAGADLAGADLAVADLAGADLARADLAGADLSEEGLRQFKADMWLTLTEADANEVRFLIAALKAGAVDGSTYGDGKSCACLVGTLARFQGEDGEARDHSASRPAERWFMMIRPGDAPGRVDDDGKETGGGFAARKALQWAEEWCAATGTDPEFPTSIEVPEIKPQAV
jgi:hypothetical protein